MALGEKTVGPSDARWPKVGQAVLVDAPPVVGWPREAQRLEVTDLRGLVVSLAPPPSLPALPRSSPVAVSVPVGGTWHRLEGWVVATGAGGLQVRLVPPPDRRQHRRHTSELDVELEVLGPPGAPSRIVAGRTLDVSAGGLRARTAEPVPSEARAFVAIALPEGPPVLALGEVLGLHGDEVHLRFTTIADEERGRLVLYLSAIGPRD